jgi:hypothetical protein
MTSRIFAVAPAKGRKPDTELSSSIECGYVNSSLNFVEANL